MLFFRFLVQMRIRKFASEIYWPLKTFTTHSFEMQSITNEPTLLRRSRHDTGKHTGILQKYKYLAESQFVKIGVSQQALVES